MGHPGFLSRVPTVRETVLTQTPLQANLQMFASTH